MPQQLSIGKNHLAGIGLFGLVTLVFLPAIGHDFISLDDPGYVVQNPHIQQGLSWASLAWCFNIGYALNWHPVTWLSHMIDWQLFGANPAGHHLVNVFMHAANAVMLFYLIMAMTRESEVSGPRRLTVAVLSSLVFAIHPLRVESVAWVAERKDVLSAFFFLATLHAYLRQMSRPSAWSRAAVACLFGLAIMAKPMVVTLPFVLLLLDFWPLNRWTRAQWTHLIKEKWLLFLMAAMGSLLTYLAQAESAVIAVTQRPLSTRLSNAVMSYVHYLMDSCIPVNLHIYYPFDASGFSALAIIAAIVALAVVTVTSWLTRKQHPWCLVGWLWYLGTLVPVIGIVAVGTMARADRYTYLPTMLLPFCLLWLVRTLRQRLFVAASMVCCLYILSATVLTRQQLSHWRDSQSLYRHAIGIQPDNHVAHYLLANVLSEGPQAEEAHHHLDRALQARDDYVPALLLKSILLAENQEWASVGPYLQRLRAANPRHADQRYNMAILFDQSGDANSALQILSDLVRTYPHQSLFRNAYNQIALKQKEPTTASEP